MYIYRIYVLIWFLVPISAVFGQDDDAIIYHEEQNWLRELEKQDKQRQLEIIKSKYIEVFEDAEEVPLLIVNGVPVHPEDSEMIGFIQNELTAENVEISFVTKYPEGLYINKKWSGGILISITDRKLRKKIRRIGD